MGRLAFRNLQPFWYALYNRTVEEYDEWGNIQRGTHAEPGPPVKAYGNISPAQGDVVERQFGDAENYDKTIVVGDRDTPIDEYAVIWIDREPILDLGGGLQVDDNGQYLTPWNYKVVRVARGLPPYGSAVIAVKQVNVS